MKLVKYAGFLTLAGLVSAAAVSCGGSSDGGSGGSGGSSSTGRAGSSAGTSGGAGSSGSGGSTAGGGSGGSTAGTGGSTAGTGGSTAGTGGSTAGTGGDAGTTGGAGAAGGSSSAATLIGYWKFDEGTGTSVADSSGNNLTGTIVTGPMPVAPPTNTAPVWVADRKAGKALALDGKKKEWVNIPAVGTKIDSAINQLSNAWSLTAWVKVSDYQDQSNPTRATGAFIWVASRAETTNGISMGNEWYGLALLDGKPTASVHFTFVSGNSVTPKDEWVFLAATYNGKAETIYQNGVKLKSTDNPWQFLTDDSTFIIGANHNASGVTEFFNGAIDEVRLYDGELTADEVNAIYKM